jgi:hypothetical protein
MTLNVRSSGRIAHIDGADPSLEQATEVDVEHVSFDKLAARSLSLVLRTKGDAFRHEANLDLQAKSLTVGEGAPSDDHVAMSASVDRSRRSLRIALDVSGRMVAKVTASASFDLARRAIDYDVAGRVGGLEAMGPLLAHVHGLDGVDWSQLDVTLSSRGALLGTVTNVGRDGTFELAPHPSKTVGVDGRVDLHVSNLHWTHSDDGVIVPDLAWRGILRFEGEHRTLESHLDVAAFHLDLGPSDVDATNLRDDTSLVLGGDLVDPTTAITEHLALATVQQDVAPQYPFGDVAFALSAERDPSGLVRIDDLTFANGAAGTGLHVSGNLQLGGVRHTLSLTTTLDQDLGRLNRAPERFSGRGSLKVEANVVSPDLAQLRVHAAVKAHDVYFTVPRAGVEVQKADGEVPVTVTLEVGKNGVALKHDEARSPYSMLRFTDQHPLLNRSGFLSVASIKSPYVTIAPLVGNLEIEQRVISLRQFELGVRHGTITGQCGLDWDGPKSTFELHVRATGVQSSHGEPFDGNIAVVVSAGDRTVEGRADILRIGERHLLDLLDLQDPTHADPAMNRIRTALLFGYPDRLRLIFDHGFVSARLELGGLARLVSISEIRGIPMGPLVDRMLASPSDTQGGP